MDSLRVGPLIRSKEGRIDLNNQDYEFEIQYK